MKIPRNPSLKPLTKSEVIASGQLEPLMVGLPVNKNKAELPARTTLLISPLPSPSWSVAWLRTAGRDRVLYQRGKGLLFVGISVAKGALAEAVEHSGLELGGALVVKLAENLAKNIREKDILKDPDKYEHDPYVECVPFQEITEVAVRPWGWGRFLVLTHQDTTGQETHLFVPLIKKKKEWTQVSPTQLMLWRFWLERQAVWEQALEEKVGLRDSELATYVASIRSQGPVITPEVRDKCEAELQRALQSRMKDKSVSFDEIVDIVQQRLAHFAVIPWCAKRASERVDLLSICAEPLDLWKEFNLVKLPAVLEETCT